MKVRGTGRLFTQNVDNCVKRLSCYSFQKWNLWSWHFESHKHREAKFHACLVWNRRHFHWHGTQGNRAVDEFTWSSVRVRLKNVESCSEKKWSQKRPQWILWSQIKICHSQSSRRERANPEQRTPRRCDSCKIGSELILRRLTENLENVKWQLGWITNQSRFLISLRDGVLVGCLRQLVVVETTLNCCNVTRTLTKWKLTTKL